MARPIINNVLVLLGAILFSIIFWHEKMGINTLFFTIFLLGSLWYLNKEAFQMQSVQTVAGGTLLLALLVVWHNSAISIIIYILSLAVCIGLIHHRELRFLFYAGVVFGLNFMETPLHFVKNMVMMPVLGGKTGIAKGIKLVLISVIILPIFYFLYYVANPKFAELSNNFWNPIFKWFAFDWNVERVFFFVWGFMIVGAALWQNTRRFVPDLDKQNKMSLDEADYSAEDNHFSILGMDEKMSYTSALILLGLLNIMLFFNNILDFTYVWLGSKTGQTAAELKQYVHEGTYFLIVAILLALAVIMFLFKGKVNFLENNKVIKTLGYTWIGQNAFLALSVGMRNWQYIDHYGLAYKRIGVVLFLILVLYGLYLMYIKIKEKRTVFYFLTKGCWAIYAVMLAACLVNWDIFITKYNLNTKTKSNTLDVPFLVRTVSDKNLYLLYENRTKLIEKMPNKPFETDYFWENNTPVFAHDSLKIAYLDKLISQKKNRFLENQKLYSALSWNYSDYRNKKRL